jgi:hypothetical protein
VPTAHLSLYLLPVPVPLGARTGGRRLFYTVPVAEASESSEPAEPFGVLPRRPTPPEDLSWGEPESPAGGAPRERPARIGPLGAVLGAAMFALRDILEPSRREEPAIVIETAEPARDVETDGVAGNLAHTVHFHSPALPRCSVWQARPRGRAPHNR